MNYSQNHLQTARQHSEFRKRSAFFAEKQKQKQKTLEELSSNNSLNIPGLSCFITNVSNAAYHTWGLAGRLVVISGTHLGLSPSSGF